MKDKCKFTGSSGYILIPDDVRNDERLSDGAILLYGDLQRLIDKKNGSANISLQTLCEVTRKKETQIKIAIRRLVSAGYLRKSKTAFGAANSYTLVDPLEGVYQDLSAFLEFSHYFSPLKMQSLLSKYKDVKTLLYRLEALEWQYTKSNRPIDFPAGIIAKVMKQKNFVPEDDFVPGWWKAKIEESRREREAKQMRKKKEALEKSEAVKMKKFLDSLSGDEFTDLREKAIKALKRNGGIPQFGAEIVIKNKMYELSLGGRGK